MDKSFPFHLHIVPLKEGDLGISEYKPRQFLQRTGSGAASPSEELTNTAEIIRKNF